MSVPLLVIGVGNRDRGDDGAGPAAAVRLGAAACAPVALLEGGDGTALLNVWRGADTVVVVDAMKSGATPGTVLRLDASGESGAAEVATLLGAGRTGASTHGLGLAEAVALGQTLGRLPRRLVIIGVEGACFDGGAAVSPAVERALDEVVRLGLEEIENVPRTAR